DPVEFEEFQRVAIHDCSRPDAAPRSRGEPLRPVAAPLTDTRGPSPVHARIHRLSQGTCRVSDGTSGSTPAPGPTARTKAPTPAIARPPRRSVAFEESLGPTPDGFSVVAVCGSNPRRHASG